MQRPEPHGRRSTFDMSGEPKGAKLDGGSNDQVNRRPATSALEEHHACPGVRLNAMLGASVSNTGARLQAWDRDEVICCGRLTHSEQWRVLRRAVPSLQGNHIRKFDED